MDPHSSYSTIITSNESKGVQFPAAEKLLIKLIGGDKSVVTCDSSNISAFVPQEYQIRMCSDEFD